jgi:AcrR family transcriptional regulator
MLEVTARLFARKGPSVSMEEIAGAAGVTKPMLYAYFGSKEGLFAATAEAAGAKLRSRLREVVGPPGTSPDERLWRGFLEVFSFVEDHRDAWLVLYPSGEATSGALGGGAIRAREAMADLLAELFADTGREAGLGEQAQAQIPMLAHAVTGATIAAASWWLSHPGEPKELAAMRLVNLVWAGMERMLAGRIWVPPPVAG